MTAREVDVNGYITIKRNPITRVGVFPYLGKQISKECDPDKIYFVYRPAEELADPACQQSFQHIPFIDDHTMLGPSDQGYTPAEKKGVHGITGERLDFDGDVLYSDIKIFSESLADSIEDGKVDLSLGYRCKYENASGSFAGQSYDYVQRSLRGNHIALVDQARCDVSVLDSQITMDRLDLKPNEEDQKMTLDEALKEIATLKAGQAKLQTAMDEMEKEKEKEAKDAEEEEKKKKDAEDEDKEKSDKEAKDEEEKKEKEAKDAEMCAEKDKMKGMDAALKTVKSELDTLKKGGMKALMSEINARNQLASKVEMHVGTFDHMEMTLDEVAAYGIDKLKIKCDKGHERAALDGYLQGRGNPSNVQAVSFDHAPASKGLDAYLSNKTA